MPLHFSITSNSSLPTTKFLDVNQICVQSLASRLVVQSTLFGEKLFPQSISAVSIFYGNSLTVCNVSEQCISWARCKHEEISSGASFDLV